mmetsp:Transcript_40382/g.67657  ORF Transcript_40382/g.67657 Transcript_40382/m.67657 type:complete len:157 (+) Transcript_40382:110-580(+)
MSTSIKQSGSCHCGEVQFEVEGTVLFNGICHCRNCTRNRGCASVHIIGVTPKTCVTITKGESLITVHGEVVSRAFCSKCGCVIHQGPVSNDMRAVLPTTFHIEKENSTDCLLPEHYKPKMHLNYENRQWDSTDDLPKWKVFPGMGPKLDNHGNKLA